MDAQEPNRGSPPPRINAQDLSLRDGILLQCSSVVRTALYRLHLRFLRYLRYMERAQCPGFQDETRVSSITVPDPIPTTRSSACMGSTLELFEDIRSGLHYSIFPSPSPHLPISPSHLIPPEPEPRNRCVFFETTPTSVKASALSQPPECGAVAWGCSRSQPPAASAWDRVQELRYFSMRLECVPALVPSTRWQVPGRRQASRNNPGPARVFLPLCTPSVKIQVTSYEHNIDTTSHSDPGLQ